jgi:ribosomal subunit interface protein
MTIQITGKNVDAGTAFKDYVSNKLPAALEKYVGNEISGHLRLEKERNGRFHTDCSIRLASGIVLEARGDADSAYASADAAIERLETRVRRHKRRLKSHHNGRDTSGSVIEFHARDYTVSVDDEAAGEANDHHPVIVAETERSIPELPVSAAVMQLDLADRPFWVFRNAAHGGLNVVYRRPDGNIGWIDAGPSSTSPKSSSNARG